MVLPSSDTCQRQEAVEVQRMLADLPASPADAAERHAPSSSFLLLLDVLAKVAALEH